jgi:hypothetical protein
MKYLVIKETQLMYLRIGMTQKKLNVDKHQSDQKGSFNSQSGSNKQYACCTASKNSEIYKNENKKKNQNLQMLHNHFKKKYKKIKVKIEKKYIWLLYRSSSTR